MRTTCPHSLSVAHHCQGASDSLYCTVYCAVRTQLQASKASVRIHSATALRHLCTGTAGYELRLCMGVKLGSVCKWTKSRRETSGSHSGNADNSSLYGCDGACWPVVRRHRVAHQKTRTNGAPRTGHKMEGVKGEKIKPHRQLQETLE